MSLTARWDTTDRLERDIFRCITWRLIPALMLAYFSASPDRANVGMAATIMDQALHFSSAQFGIGAETIGYQIGDFEVGS